MKISKIFHFLYFSVLSIPLISMPIFAIYSQNHEITGYEVTINESYWDVQDKYQSNEVENVSDLVRDNVYLFNFDPQAFEQDSYIDFSFRLLSGEMILNNTRIEDHYFDDGVLTLSTDQPYIFDYQDYNGFVQISYNNIDYFTISGQFLYTTDAIIQFISLDDSSGNVDYGYLFDYTDYNEKEAVYFENEPVTYNDTDIMSQFIYNEYNFMDKYLGIYKFSPFNDIYQWLQNTFFGGAAPMVFTIFYQWFAYWLFVSLCWLIFDVLMYVPLVVHRWLDKGALE